MFISNFVSDGDAPTRNLLTNGYKTLHLPDAFPTSTFLADLNHCIKYIAKTIFGLTAMNKRISRINRGDALRINRNYYWYFKSQIKKKVRVGKFQDFVNGTKAPLYHHFRCTTGATVNGIERSV